MQFDVKAFFDAYRESFGKVKAEQVQPIEFLINQINTDEKWTSLEHIAYFMATVYWETAQTFQPIKERGVFEAGGKWWRQTRNPAGKSIIIPCQYGKFFGRGYVQLTWATNYDSVGRRLGLGTQLLDSPDLAQRPDIAYRIAADGMREGWFTGKRLSHYLNAEKEDFISARKIINGLDKAQTIGEIAMKFKSILKKALNRKVGEAVLKVAIPQSAPIIDAIEKRNSKPGPLMTSLPENKPAKTSASLPASVEASPVSEDVKTADTPATPEVSEESVSAAESMLAKAKPLLTSRTFWGVAILLLGAKFPLFKDWTGEQTALWVASILDAIGTILAVYGRLKATQPIKGVIK